MASPLIEAGSLSNPKNATIVDLIIFNISIPHTENIKAIATISI